MTTSELNQPVPYTLTPQAEAVLDAGPGPGPEPEPEAGLSEPWWAAHVTAREAGPEPEAEL